MTKIVVVIFGRFHFFELSRCIEKNSYLLQLITTYPKFYAAKWGITASKITSIFHLDLARRFLSKIGLFNKNTNTILKKYFSFLVNILIKNDSNLLIVFAGNSFSSDLISNFKSKNGIVIVDEGSAHVSYQYSLMQTEYSSLKLKFGLVQSDEMVNETLKEYSLSDYIVVPSSFVKKTFIEKGFTPDKIFVNPYGVDLQSFTKGTKKDDVFRIIYCGRLSYQKGSHYLLKAISLLPISNFEFWHVGGVDPDFKVVLDKYNNSKIKLLGPKDQSQLAQYYSQCDVFIMPSLQDGFGMVILQAMACGLPVIISENTAAYDVISNDGKEGFVIPPFDHKVIIDRIVYLFDNPEQLKRMSIAAQNRVTHDFSWDDYCHRYSCIINEIIEREKLH